MKVDGATEGTSGRVERRTAPAFPHGSVEARREQSGGIGHIGS